MARLVTQYLYESEAAGVLFPDGFPQGKLCGIALDGASSNMSERVELGKVLKEAWASKGETKSNIEVNHCAPHRLSLAINSAFSSVDYLHNKFDPFLLDTALWYQNSSNRKDKLKLAIEDFGFGGTIEKPCPTRWLTRDHSVNSLRETLPAVCDELEHHAEHGDQKARASGLHHQLRTFNFIFTLSMLSDVLPVLTSFSTSLQAKDVDIGVVVDTYEICLSKLTKFEDGLQEMLYMQEAVGLTRDGKLSFSDVSAEAEDFQAKISRKAEFFEAHIKTPFLKALKEELFSRFMERLPEFKAKLAICKPADLVPPKPKDLATWRTAKADGQKADRFLMVTPSLQAAFNDISAADPGTTSRELEIEFLAYKRFLLRHQEKAAKTGNALSPLQTLSDLSSLLKSPTGNVVADSTFPKIKALVEELVSLPQTSVCVERGFAHVKRVVTNDRSTLTEVSLCNLLFILLNGPPMGSPAAEALVKRSAIRWSQLCRRRALAPEYFLKPGKGPIFVKGKRKSRRVGSASTFYTESEASRPALLIPVNPSAAWSTLVAAGRSEKLQRANDRAQALAEAQSSRLARANVEAHQSRYRAYTLG